MSCASPLCQLRHWHHLSRLVNSVCQLVLIISAMYSKHNVSGIRTTFKSLSKVKTSQINQKPERLMRANKLILVFGPCLEITRLIFQEKHADQSVRLWAFVSRCCLLKERTKTLETTWKRMSSEQMFFPHNLWHFTIQQKQFGKFVSRRHKHVRRRCILHHACCH